MTETATPSTARTRAKAVPQPMLPNDGAPVDGSAAAFEWTRVPGATTYRVQVAADSDFEDVVYTVNAGATTLLTLFEMLPNDGSTFYWRVQAHTATGWQPWSEAAVFTADTDENAQSYEAQQEAETTERASHPTVTESRRTAELPEEQVVPPSPYQRERTSGGTILFYLAVMIISFAITLMLIVGAVVDMQR